MMDPNEAYRIMMLDDENSNECANALWRWLDNGGFAPSGLTVNDTYAAIQRYWQYR